MALKQPFWGQNGLSKLDIVPNFQTFKLFSTTWLGLTPESHTEVLSEAGYATAFYGKGHLGDVEESYL